MDRDKSVRHKKDLERAGASAKGKEKENKELELGHRIGVCLAIPARYWVYTIHFPPKTSLHIIINNKKYGK